MNPELIAQVRATAESGEIVTLARIVRETRDRWAHMMLQHARAKKAGRGDDASRALDLADALFADHMFTRAA